jgi:hypothetical protein
MMTAETIQVKKAAAAKLDTKAVTVLRQVARTGPEPVSGGNVSPETMKWLYDHAKSLAEELCVPQGFPVPEVIISVDYNSIRQLGHFKIGRDGLGLKWRVSMNLRHLARARGNVLATLLHEMLHAWEHQSGKPPKNPKTHNVAFRAACEKLGIPCGPRGHSLGITPDGLFHQYLVKHEIQGQVGLVPRAVAGKGKGSPLKKFICACEGDDLVPIRVARVDDFDATCNKCGERYQLAE